MGKATGLYHQKADIMTLTATTDSGRVIPLWKAPTEHGVVLKSIYISGVWTASATHYMTLTIKDGSGNTISVPTLSTTSCTGTGFLACQAPIAAQSELSAGEAMSVTVSQTGNGLSATGLVIWWEYSLLRI